MSGLVDTSVIVRYLTGDPPDLADRAAGLLDGEEGLEVTDVALVEAAYVLTSAYGVSRQVVVDSLVELLQKENLRPHGLERATVVEALLLCRPSGRVSFADALIGAAARSADIGRIYTFDDDSPTGERPSFGDRRTIPGEGGSGSWKWLSGRPAASSRAPPWMNIALAVPTSPSAGSVWKKIRAGSTPNRVSRMSWIPEESYTDPLICG